MEQLTLAFTIYLSMLVPVLAWLIIRRIDRLEVRVDRLPTREEFNGLAGRVDRHDSRFDRIDADIAAMRSDLTQIALVVGARTRPQTG